MKNYDRLSVQDRLHLDIENDDIHMHVAGAFVFEAGPLTREGGGIDIDRIRELLGARLFLIPRYRQRIATIPVEDHPVWVDDASFNLQYHVRHTRLPHPGSERQFKRMVGRIVSQRLDRGKPLWEMWVVEGLEHDRVALVVKVHHCMVDGIAATDLLQTLLSTKPVKTLEPPPIWLPRPVPEPRELLGGAVQRRVRAPLALGSALLRIGRHPSTTLERARRGVESLLAAQAARATPVSGTPFNQPIGPHRRFDWLAFDLDEVKRIKRNLGGTVNDVVLATVAGALGDFLEQRGITRPEQRKLEFRIACPVSTRSSSERVDVGNQVSSLIVPLPIAERDPRRRLALVNDTTRGLKAVHPELAVQFTQTVSEWTWPGLYSAVAKRMIESRVTNLTVSDVPGPQLPLYLLAARMLEAYPLVPLLPDQGLGIACLSYAGALFWGFNADWDLIPDLHDLVIAIDRSFCELCDAAGGGE
jgi:WS/DGAT/MGAT family acyltransferase